MSFFVYTSTLGWISCKPNTFCVLPPCVQHHIVYTQAQKKKKKTTNPHQHVQVLTYAAVQIHILTVLVRLHVTTDDILFMLTSLPKPDFPATPTVSIQQQRNELPKVKKKKNEDESSQNLPQLDISSFSSYMRGEMSQLSHWRCHTLVRRLSWQKCLQVFIRFITYIFSLNLYSLVYMNILGI